MLYLDTSALLKLYIREAGSEAVQAKVQSQDMPLPVWEYQEAEFVNALRLKAFWQEITSEQAEAQIGHFEARKRKGYYFYPEIARSELMELFRKLSSSTPRTGCRTLDILHVACALQIRATAFLTFDARQSALAAESGLQVMQWD